MSNAQSKMYDEHDNYEELCKKVKETPIGISDNWRKHEEEIMKKYKYEQTYFGYQKINL